jgi:hypothetical protein
MCVSAGPFTEKPVTAMVLVSHTFICGNCMSYQHIPIDSSNGAKCGWFAEQKWRMDANVWVSLQILKVGKDVKAI